MSNVIHKSTLEARASVNTPDYPDSSWLINPLEFDAIEQVPQRYRKLNGDDVAEMTEAEKSAVDIAELAAQVGAYKAEAISLIQQDSGLKRLLVALSVVNKRELKAIKGNNPRASKTIDELAQEAAAAIIGEEIE